MKRFSLLLILTLLINYTIISAEGGIGHYRLFGKAYDNLGTVLKNEKISFVVHNTPSIGKTDTIVMKTDSLGNFELQITWMTVCMSVYGQGAAYNKANEAENPPILALWNNKTISITNRWKEMIDINENLYFE